MNKSLIAVGSVLALVGCNRAPDEPGVVGACENGAPGVRIHLRFAESTTVGPPSWSDRHPLSLSTMGGGLVSVKVLPTYVGQDRSVTLSADYPPGTIAGPAETSFYAIAGGLTQWQSDIVQFTADPAACVDVELPVRFVDNATLPDAAD